MFKWLMDLVEYRELFLYLVYVDIKSRYKGTSLGLFWSLLNPVITILIFRLAFIGVVQARIQHYLFFLALGVIPWQFFSNTLSTSSSSLTGFASLIRNAHFPRKIIPLIQVVSNFVNSLAVGAIILIPFMITYHSGFYISFLALPLVAGIELVFVSGLSLVVSYLQVKFRDAQVILSHVMLFWFFLTPVFYERGMFESRFRWIVALNPMAWIIRWFRLIVMDGKFPDSKSLFIVGTFVLIVFFVSAFFFEKEEPYLAEEV